MSAKANPDPPSTTSTERLAADLRSAIRRITTRLRSERAEGELGDAALDVLVRLHKHGPLSLSELSEQARVTPGSMSQTVNRLTTGEYAVRGPDPADRRRVLFTLLPAGQAIAAETRSRRTGWLLARLDELDADDRAALTRATEILRRISDT